MLWYVKFDPNQVRRNVHNIVAKPLWLPLQDKEAMDAKRDDRYDYYWCLLAWLMVWGALLHMKPGAREVKSSYRLNFWHAVVSSVIALACMYDPMTVPESITTSCSQAYFITDFINMVMNDFVYKVGGYHKKTARRVEYCHHILCIACCFTTEIAHTTLCQFPLDIWGVAPSGKQRNPTVRIMMAELSTPFLMRWRMTGEKNDVLFYLFVLTFVASRVIYQCIQLMPWFCFYCVDWVAYGFAIPYMGLQVMFTYFVLRKGYAIYKGKKLWDASEENRGFESGSPPRESKKMA